MRPRFYLMCLLAYLYGRYIMRRPRRWPWRRRKLAFCVVEPSNEGVWAIEKKVKRR